MDEQGNIYASNLGSSPGADLEKDVLAHMDFSPIMNTPPKLMDARIFTDAVMGLAKEST